MNALINTDYIFLSNLSANTNTPIKTTTRTNFTKLSWDTDIRGVKFTVEAIKINSRDSYYARVIYDGKPIRKITPRTPVVGPVAQELYQDAQIVAKRQAIMARVR